MKITLKSERFSRLLVSRESDYRVFCLQEEKNLCTENRKTESVAPSKNLPANQ